MYLTGGEIISLIHRQGLEHVECRFSMPKDIYDLRVRKYRILSQQELEDVFNRYTHGEKLTDLAKEYGTSISYLSVQNKKILKRRANHGKQKLRVQKGHSSPGI